MLFLTIAALAIPATLAAQGGADIIRQQGEMPIAPHVTYPFPKDLTYKLAWAVNVGPEKPDSIVPGFRSPAGFLYIGDANGVPRRNIHQAVVVWGTATHSLLKNEAYRKAKGTDNASIPLLEALNDAGVEIIVCWVALINRKIDRADLLPFVKIAPTAQTALATLNAKGYTTYRP
jgi:intracellular sulfur oxidation DsrE/DsrF family protein